MQRRISIIGTSGCGKTTLARELADILHFPHIELDALHWESNWTPAREDIFQSRVIAAISAESWTICGNYGTVQPMVLARADTIIWLDYSLSINLARILRRTFRRCWSKQILWNGNRESVWMTLTSRDSIILWVLSTWRRRRRDFPKLLRQQRQVGKRVFRFRTPSQNECWLNYLKAHDTAEGPHLV
jgi:adenylate kinase family enzyme